MTGATEAKLFREAEICYAMLNLVTDYDVWRDDGETVSVDLIMENLRLNIDNAKAIVRGAVAASRRNPAAPAVAPKPFAAPSSPTRRCSEGNKGQAPAAYREVHAMRARP